MLPKQNFLLILFASSHTKQLPVVRSVVPSQPGCPAAALGSLRKWELKKDLALPDKPVQGAREVQSQAQLTCTAS